jgi:hypothetical protein
MALIKLVFSGAGHPTVEDVPVEPEVVTPLRPSAVAPVPENAFTRPAVSR